MAAALDYCCQYFGGNREELIAQLKNLKAVGAKIVPQSKTQIEPMTSKPPTGPMAHSEKCATEKVIAPNLYQNALDILGGLVLDADKSRLGGCVILAAPGGGKTTFLGTAWGRLKAIYEENFKSLAVVFKSSDVEAFQACSDRALCVKDSPMNAAIAIIKFIDEGMRHQGQVRRLFLDDFLTMNQYLVKNL